MRKRRDKKPPRDIERLAYEVWRGERDPEELWKCEIVRRVAMSVAKSFRSLAPDYWMLKARKMLKDIVQEWNPVRDRDFLSWFRKALRERIAKEERKYTGAAHRKRPGMGKICELALEYEEAKKRLKKKLGRNPKDEEMAEELGWSVKEVRSMEEFIYKRDKDLLIDAPFGVVKMMFKNILSKQKDGKMKSLYRDLFYYDGSVPLKDIAKRHGLTMKEFNRLREKFWRELKEMAELFSSL